VVFPGDCELALETFPDPTPGRGEVVLGMKASGMCGSDLHAYRAPKGRRFTIGRATEEPVIAGHEPCGVVVAVGVGVSEREARVGQRVMCHQRLSLENISANPIQ
jgi:threonine dehydrogenase-like Zn-dependent dehydrogenase